MWVVAVLVSTTGTPNGSGGGEPRPTSCEGQKLSDKALGSMCERSEMNTGWENEIGHLMKVLKKVHVRGPEEGACDKVPALERDSKSFNWERGANNPAIATWHCTYKEPRLSIRRVRLVGARTGQYDDVMTTSSSLGRRFRSSYARVAGNPRPGQSCRSCDNRDREGAPKKSQTKVHGPPPVRGLTHSFSASHLEGVSPRTGN